MPAAATSPAKSASATSFNRPTAKTPASPASTRATSRVRATRRTCPTATRLAANKAQHPVVRRHFALILEQKPALFGFRSEFLDLAQAPRRISPPEIGIERQVGRRYWKPLHCPRPVK